MSAALWGVIGIIGLVLVVADVMTRRVVSLSDDEPTPRPKPRRGVELPL